MRLLLPLLLLAGCTDSAAPAPTPASPATPAPATPPAAEPAAALAPASDPAAPADKSPVAEIPEDDKNAEIGMVLMEKEIIGGLSIGAAAAKVEKVAGRPKKKSKPEMSEALGMYVSSWTYPDAGLELGMSAEKKKGPYKVMSVRITRPSSFKTSKGIGIGSPLAEVERAYPKNASESSDTQFVAGSVYGGLQFEVVAGKVDSMFLGASAE